MNGVVVERLGTAVPGEHGGDAKRDTIDGHPIVLWRGDTPAAVFYTRERSSARFGAVEQRIERLDQPARSPFPLSHGSPWPSPSGPPDLSEYYDVDHIVTADVNGDGVDELILPRHNGAIEVYTLEKKLHASFAPPAPTGKAYAVERSFVARLAGHDVVLLLLALDEQPGRPEHDEDEDDDGDDPNDADGNRRPSRIPDYAVVRIDRKGIARLPLPPRAEWVIAVGGINRPGSSELDEVLMLYRAMATPETIMLARLGKGDVWVEPPKQVYVAMHGGLMQFVSLAQTASAIVVDRPSNHAYFIQPDKPSNWISDVDLGPLSPGREAILPLEAVEPGPDPKLVVQAEVVGKEGRAPTGHALFALNREGACFAPAPAGAGWRPLPKVEPFLTLAKPSKDHMFVGLLHQTGTESLLSLYTREAKPRQLSDQEVFEAADKFLAPEYVAEVRRRFLGFGVEDLRNVFNSSDEERRRRGVTQEIKTVEEWRRLLPDSYAEVLAHRTQDLLARLEVRLTDGLDKPLDPEIHRSVDEYATWLEGIRGKAETVFDIVSRGQLIARFSIPGSFPEELRRGTWERRFDWRPGTAAATVVLPLDPTPSVSTAKQRWGFFRVVVPTRSR